MAIGERIHFFRTMRGMTQKYLGMALGFPGEIRRCPPCAVREWFQNAQSGRDRCAGTGA